MYSLFLVSREIYCDYEGGSECHLKNADNNKENWFQSSAISREPAQDHTTNSGFTIYIIDNVRTAIVLALGNYLYFTDTDKSPGGVSYIISEFQQTTDQCLELYYFHLGEGGVYLEILVRNEFYRQLIIYRSKVLYRKL